jgi:KUP system potassium uptake protein
VSLIPPDHESEAEQMESSPHHNRIKAVCTFASFIGASLVLGDGAITPAISVLSAVEGIDVALPWTAVYVLPITCGILVGLFMIQRFGTHVMGIVFGPIMLVWFFSIGAIGFLNIVASPHCLRAFNPMYGVLFFTRNGSTGWVLLGAVVLAVTGVEVKYGPACACARSHGNWPLTTVVQALYADLGHFGQWPVRLSWSFIVFPALVMNYLGQVGRCLPTSPPES